MGKKPHRRNSLYSLLAEYLRNQPDAKPAQAWEHFGNLTLLGGTPGLIAFDGQALEFAPDPECIRTKTVSRTSFARRFQFLRDEIQG